MTAFQRILEAALDHQRSGFSEKALTLYRRLAAMAPNHPGILWNSGLVHAGTRRWDESATAFRRVVRLTPDNLAAHTRTAAAWFMQGRADRAIPHLKVAVALDPADPALNADLATAWQVVGEAGGAADCCRRALALRPYAHDLLLRLGNARFQQHRHDLAQAAYRRAACVAPQEAVAWMNLANILQVEGRFKASQMLYGRAATIASSPLAHLNLAIARLRNGELAEGWTGLEWRWADGIRQEERRHQDKPAWDGTARAETVFLHAEQGLGDTLQFIRYAHLVTDHIAPAGGTVIVECQEPLKRLLAGIPGLAGVYARGDALPPFDRQCPLMSLPAVFGTTLATVPAQIPYLTPERQAVANWRERLAGVPGLRVGVVWAGESRPHAREMFTTDLRRSVALRQFAPLAAIPGVSLVSLQKGKPATQRHDPELGFAVLDWMDTVEDFADTAALAAVLDLVISVDTSVAHLAGALGRPVWLLSRYDGCWRWLADRDDSPWYPTLRLFRQETPGDWDGVVRRVVDALTAEVARPR